MVEVFVKIPWVDGTDAEYYKFNSLQSAVEWLNEERENEFVISKEPMDIPESDYTVIEDEE